MKRGWPMGLPRLLAPTSRVRPPWGQESPNPAKRPTGAPSWTGLPAPLPRLPPGPEKTPPAPLGPPSFGETMGAEPRWRTRGPSSPAGNSGGTPRGGPDPRSSAFGWPRQATRWVARGWGSLRARKAQRLRSSSGDRMGGRLKRAKGRLRRARRRPAAAIASSLSGPQSWPRPQEPRGDAANLEAQAPGHGWTGSRRRGPWPVPPKAFPGGLEEGRSETRSFCRRP
jgi:hypothetical protein